MMIMASPIQSIPPTEMPTAKPIFRPRLTPENDEADEANEAKVTVAEEPEVCVTLDRLEVDEEGSVETISPVLSRKTPA
jgi:hypothetical protein